jgi:carboxylesterase type B
MWTEKDRAAASRDAAIALEVATAAAEAAQGKKKKEQPAPYWTRLHEKSRSTVRFQKEMERVMEDCDFY